METRSNLVLRGQIKKITKQNKIFGIVIFDPSLSEVSVRLEARVDGELVASGVADIELDDVKEHCRKAFRIKVPPWVTEETVRSDRFLLLVFIADKILAADLHKDFCDNRSQKTDELLSEMNGIEIGQVSLDQSSVMGKGGFFFLSKGSNDLSALYRKKDVNISDRWVVLLNKRVSYFETSSCQYQQIFIPEKSTILNSFLPYKFANMTPSYKNLKDKVRANVNLNYSTLFYDDLLRGDDALRVYRKKDTHFTTYGSEVLLKAILQNLSLDKKELYEVGPSKRVSINSDLGGKFGANFRQEQVDVYEILKVNGVVMHPQLLSEKIPVQGKQGTVRVYQNFNAPFGQKVIGFVNSFFWQNFNSFGISWWLSRLFREYHFVWSPDVDFDYIEENEPDVVIAQTIERFMHRVPNK